MKLMLALLAAAAVGTFAAAETPNTQADWYTGYFRDSRLVEIAPERRLNLYCEGEGSPTVVLEAGLGDGASSWWPVQDALARTTRVCAYDRAGHGRSPHGPLPRDTKSEVADLERLLETAALRGPYVLVGHSMGAYNVRLFASRHPDAVAGLVLVDGSVENQGARFAAIEPDWAALSNRNAAILKKCAETGRSAAVADACIGKPPPGFPESFSDQYRESQGPAHFAAAVAERDAFDGLDSAELIAERHPLGKMPLIVLTAGAGMNALPIAHAAEIGQEWSRMHDEVAALSARGVNRTVEGASHYIQRDRPEAVISAVNEVVEAARKSNAR